MKIKEINPFVDEDNVENAVDAVIHGCINQEDQNAFVRNIKHALTEYFETYLSHALLGTEQWKLVFVEGERDIDSEKEFMHVLGDLYNIESEGQTEEEKSLFYVPGMEVYANDDKKEIKIYMQCFLEDFDNKKKSFSFPDLMMNVSNKFYTAAYSRYSKLRGLRAKGFDVFDVDLEMYEDLLGQEEAEFLYDTEQTVLGIRGLISVVKAYEVVATEDKEQFATLIRIMEKAAEADDKSFDEEQDYSSWIGFPEEVYGMAATRSVFMRVFKDVYDQAKMHKEKENESETVVAEMIGLSMMKKSLEKLNKWLEQEYVDLSQESYEVGRLASVCVKGFNEEFYFDYLKALYFSKNTLAPDYTVDLVCKVVDGGRPYKKTRDFVNNIIQMTKEANAINKDEKLKGFYALVALVHSSYILKLNNIIGDGENGDTFGSEDERE